MSLDLGALKTFLSCIPPRGTLLDAGCASGQHLAWMIEHGYHADGFDPSEARVESAREKNLPVVCRDFRLLSLKKEFYDGIWCHQAIDHLTIEECQRVLAFFFQALKPKTGTLFLSVREKPIEEGDQRNTETLQSPESVHAYSEKAFLSLMRQSGFQVQLTAKNPPWLALLARRA